MPEFIPIDKKQENDKKQPEEKDSKASIPEVQKAKDLAEIQKYEAEIEKHKREKIEEQRLAVATENDIKDVTKIKEILAQTKERESQLGKEKYDWEVLKATEKSEIQKIKAELERKQVELNKKEQDIISRTQNLAIREKLITEREDLMNSVEHQKLEESEKYNSLSEQIKRNYHKITALLADCANILIKYDKPFGDDLWVEIETMEKWYNNDYNRQFPTILEWLKGQVDDCNQEAILMARNPKAYNQNGWNTIIDKLEQIYAIQPELKPSYLPDEKE